MFLAKRQRFGATTHVFFEEDPRLQGFKGEVLEDVSLEEEEDVSSWPLGHDMPQAALGRSIENPGRYKVFKYASAMKEADFENTGSQAFSYRDWRAYACVVGWTDGEMNAIRDDFWKRRTASCPHCATGLKLQAKRCDVGEQMDVEAACATCHLTYRISAEGDSLAPTFRDWTPSEVAAVFAAGETKSRCPSDGSVLDASLEPVHGSTIVGHKAFRFACGRCGRSAQMK